MSLLLVSGVNGFIGSNLAGRLLRDGHKVRGLVRASSDRSFLKGLDVDLFTGDVTDRPSLDPAMAGVEVAVHGAGFASDWGPYSKFHDVNVTGTKNMAEAAQAAKVRRFVHLSTAALHGFPGARNMDESSPMPNSPFSYCVTKRLAEEWLWGFSKSSGLEVTAIRPGNVFGPKDHTFIEKYAAALEQGKAGYVRGGRSWTCPAYVENLADAIALACFEPAAKGEAFIVTDGLEIDWRTFTERLADEMGVKRPGMSVPFWLGYAVASLLESVYWTCRIKSAPLLTRYRICNGGRDYHFSIAKARRLLKYEPRVGFEESIRRSVGWLRERKKEKPS